MPVINENNLRAVVRDIVSAAGSTGDEPKQVADNLVYANLTGHDSHGIGMLPRYIRAVKSGELRVNAQIEVVVDDGPMLTVDGRAGYGQVIGLQAMEMGIAKAREHGVCVMTIRRSFHLCRIGAWGEHCARAGMVSMHHVNLVGRHGLVAPFGGSDARYSTNPYCCVLPATENNPITALDFATSMVAQGKIRVARNKGEQMAEGMLLDAQGQPTTDPNATFEGGALRPFGGHKGYGMALVNELLAGVLSGGGTCRPDTDREQDSILNNMLSVIIDPKRLVSGEFYASEVDATIKHVKASPPMQTGKPVQIPGDPERATNIERSNKGIPVDEETWREMIGTAALVGIDAVTIETVAGINKAA
ncbi:MAG: putative oxidoreductase [Gammaproteobacteria bacterium]|jgi:uncharacterized oxidoreductase